LSGWSDSSIVAPGWPFGLPGLRPDLPRSDFGDGLASPSEDGGFDEFREFAFAWAARSATCDCSRPAPRGVPRSPRPAPRSGRPARPAAPAAARWQHEARSHRSRECRAPRARTNAATTSAGQQIGRHRNGRSKRESTVHGRKGQTDLSSYLGTSSWAGA
jgi:hypothetical protein